MRKHSATYRKGDAEEFWLECIQAIADPVVELVVALVVLRRVRLPSAAHKEPHRATSICSPTLPAAQTIAESGLCTAARLPTPLQPTPPPRPPRPPPLCLGAPPRTGGTHRRAPSSSATRAGRRSGSLPSRSGAEGPGPRLPALGAGPGQRAGDDLAAAGDPSAGGLGREGVQERSQEGQASRQRPCGRRLGIGEGLGWARGATTLTQCNNDFHSTLQEERRMS
jgi:hypothetical protein